MNGQIDKVEVDGKTYYTSANLIEIKSMEEYDFYRFLPNGVIIFMWVKKGITAVNIAKPTYEELAKRDPLRFWCICDCDRYPPLSRGISIYPTFKTFMRGEEIRCFKSGTSRAGIIQDFDRLFEEIHCPTEHPPLDLGVFEKVKIETKAGVSVAPKKGKAVALVGDDKNVPLVKPQEPKSINELERAKSSPNIRADSGQTLNRPSTAIPQKFDEYMALLTEKGFFKGLEVGSVSYNDRYQKASERFYTTQAAQNQANRPQQPLPHQVQKDKLNNEDKTAQMQYGLDKMKITGEYKWSKTPKLLQISSAGNYMWGLDSHGMTWRWTGTRFEQVQGQLRQISVSHDGQVWGVNFNNDILTFGPQGWSQVQGKMKQVSVASENLIWGITLADEVVVYKGNNKWDPVTSSDF